MVRRGRVEPLDAEMQTCEQKTPSVSCFAQLRRVFRPRYNSSIRPVLLGLSIALSVLVCFSVSQLFALIQAVKSD